MPVRPVLVGLVGKKRVGKDTFAAELVENHGYVRVSFADPLRDTALRLDPLVGPDRRLSDLVDAHGWEVAKSVPEVRRTLQYLGGAVRALEPGFWLRIAMRKVSDAMADGRSVVITDVRYHNEAETIRDADGILIRLVRHGQDDADTHPSERDLDRYATNYTFINEGSVADLRALAASCADWFDPKP